MLVTFHEAAYVELEKAVRRYNSQAPGLGDALAAEVQGALRGIGTFPDAGFLVRPGIRRRLLARFPYSILYSTGGDRLRVLAVMHHSQEPDYWSDRA